MAAEIGSQRLPGRSTLPGLRSIVSDLSNLLLSSVIVHFHPAARRGSRAGGIVLALAVSLAAGQHVSPRKGQALSFSARRQPQLGCKSCSALASARRRPFFDEANSGNLKLNGGGSNCWNQQELHVTRCCHFGGSSNRNRHFAEMRAALHMGKRQFRLV